MKERKKAWARGSRGVFVPSGSRTGARAHPYAEEEEPTKRSQLEEKGPGWCGSVDRVPA